MKKLTLADIQSVSIPHLGLCSSKSISQALDAEEITLVNIICPGYERRREAGSEQFDFPSLSSDIRSSTNVILMIDKMLNCQADLRGKAGKRKIKTVMILADVAILNYDQLTLHQDVKAVMNKFYESICVHYGSKLDAITFVKMSELTEEFRQIPLQGISISNPKTVIATLPTDIRKKAEEYIGSLLFSRINEYMSKQTTFLYESLQDKACHEVARFVREYGLAGSAIAKLYHNPIVLFTEPSGYARGYFYNAYIEMKSRLPVICVR